MKRALPALLTLLALTFAPGAAQACRVGTWLVLFDQPPSAQAKPGSQVIHVRFGNRREALEGLPARAPWIDATAELVGSAQLPDAPGAEAFPVYTAVSDCTHQFYGNRDWDGDYYLTGRFVTAPDGRRSFAADQMFSRDGLTAGPMAPASAPRPAG